MTKSHDKTSKNSTDQDKKEDVSKISEDEAEAGVPDDESIAGEEDPGSAIEEWVKDKKDYEERHKNDDKA
ncbi:hypothetical protein HHX48_04715 [Salinimonas sp. HHU 13199]|uniref:Nucleotide exchange factor GrpE n=1 Tax=Salinimonas profundi TaxID=2729140 RepID=A0ABR8LHM8_9ALTE|nr:hypothetical protein [Salinimonas profundi]MBD3585038.1 hypothetical protein [Salinimonas profundi]